MAIVKKMTKNVTDRLTKEEAKKLVRDLYIKKQTENPMALAEFADGVFYEMLARIEENLDCLDLETTAAIMTQIGNFSNKRRELIVKYMSETNLSRILDQKEKENPFSQPVKLVADTDKDV